jgi:hypothetical protein
MRFNVFDAPQEAMAFMISQATYIESEVYRIQYPDILYPLLVPVDSSASEWAKSITYFSIDKVGEAEWFDGYATDMRLADVNRAKYEQTIEMAGIGYRYTLEEIGQAMHGPRRQPPDREAPSCGRARLPGVHGPRGPRRRQPGRASRA